MKQYRFPTATAACLALLSSTNSPSNAFASFSTVSHAKLETLNSVLFSSRDNDDYDSNGGRRQQQFRMVKQFNGDFKAVPYDEYDADGRNNPAAESEMRRIEQMYRRHPPLTSPARALLDKQWDWQRPGDRPRPRLRQVKTFSGMMKTVAEDEYDPAFDHRVTNSQFGRVDGTGYVPDLSPEDARRDRMWMPPPPPPRFQAPPTPPPYGRQYEPGISPARRREMDRFRTKLVGEEFRREMRKYRGDDYDYGPPLDYDDFDEEEQYRNEKKDPLKSLAKSTEKFLKQITGIGRSSSQSYRPPPPPRRKYRMAPPDTRRTNFGWYQNNGANNRGQDEFGFNSSPAVRSFQRGEALPPPSYYGGTRGSTYYERGRKPSHSASRAYQSFSDPYQRQRSRESFGDLRPRYRMERQFNGDYRTTDSGYENDRDDFYDNPAANSEVGRIW